MVPERVKILLDAQRWVHNGVGEVIAIIIVFSRPVGVERGVFKNHSQPCADNSFNGVAQLQYIMALSKFGRKLYPIRSFGEPLGVKWVRQSVVITNNPSSIDQNQHLLVRFPNLRKDDVIVPGTARFTFTITLASQDANRTVVQNLGRAIKSSGNKVMSIDDSDVFLVTTLSGRQPKRGQMGIIRGSMPLITETRRRFESVSETEIQALSLTRPSLMPLVIAPSSH